MRLNVYLFLIAVLLLLVPAGLSAQTAHPLGKTFTPRHTEASLKDFFRDIEATTGVIISYSNRSLDDREVLRLPAGPQTVGQALDILLAGKKVNVVESGEKILLVPGTAATTPVAAPAVSLNGYVRDVQSGEVLIGATVYAPSGMAGTVTNNFGFYSLSLPPGKHTLYISYIGYKTDTLDLALDNSLRRDVDLREAASMQEVSVSSKESQFLVQDHMHLSSGDLENKPLLLGEADPMRSLQLQAGVQSGTDGASSVMVRGGDPGQNLHLLDGIPLYYVDHFFGLTSVYNLEAIKSIDFYKGAFPARYGGRLSSILDVHARDGDLQRIGGQFTLGLVKSSLNLEGPIVKNKAALMVSARRTYVDGLIRPFTKEVGAYFYDVNAKANWIINKNNRVYASFYNGRDQIGVSSDDVYISALWGNTVAAIKWNTIINPRIFLNTTATYSLFRYRIKDRIDLIDTSGVKVSSGFIGLSSVKDAALRIAAEWYPNPAHKIEIGTRYAYTAFSPTSLKTSDPQQSFPLNTQSSLFYSNELVLYAEDEYRYNNRWLIRPGLHFSNWFSEKFQYHSLQPRLYIAYRPERGKQVIYGSASHMAQFLHLINSNTYGLPADFWVPSTERIRPEESWQMSLGYSGTWKGLNYNVEAYYKDIDGVITYRTGKSIFDNSNHWQDKVAQGTGWTYGMELTLNRSFGKFNAALAYTLSWSWRQFSEFNDGKPFPYRYDRRHNLKTMLSYVPSKRFDATANWTFMSGEAFTLPDQIYPDFDQNLFIQPNAAFTSNNFTYYYTDWNNYRLPAIHRLDIGVNFNRYRRKHYVRTWSLGMFNVYGRPNVMFVMLDSDDEGRLRLKGVNLLSFVPYISFKLKF